MPLFDDDEESVIVGPTPTVPEVVIDTASIYQNKDFKCNIISYIEGNSWIIDYYAKYMGDDDVGSANADITDPTLIQYLKVHNFELKVTDDLAQTTDPQTSLTVVQGGSNVAPFIRPTVGDVIVGAVGDGLFGIFSVISIDRLSMFKESAFAITYNLVQYVDQAALDELEDKTVRELFFDKDAATLTTPTQAERGVLLKQYLIDLVDRYYEEFYNHIRETFMYPGSDKIYDPFVVEFWNKIVGEEIRGNRNLGREFPLRNAVFTTDYKTFWDVLFDRNEIMLNRAVKAMRNMSTSAFGANYVYHNLETSNIRHVIHPFEVGGLAVKDPIVLPHPDTYVFSDFFYVNDEPNMTPIEIETWKAIRRERPIFADVEAIYLTLDTLTPEQRFYQIPILIALFIATR